MELKFSIENMGRNAYHMKALAKPLRNMIVLSAAGQRVPVKMGSEGDPSDRGGVQYFNILTRALIMTGFFLWHASLLGPTEAEIMV